MTSQPIERGDATGATATVPPDLIDRLAGFADGSPLLALRATRADARARAQAAHDALLFPQRPGRLPAAERATLAARLTELSGDAALAAHYRALAALYAPRGAPRSDREFASAVESVLNGCVYCAFVHTRRFVELTGERGPVEALFARGVAGLSDQPRLSAIARAAARSGGRGLNAGGHLTFKNNEI